MTTVRYGGGHTVTPRLRNWAARLQEGVESEEAEIPPDRSRFVHYSRLFILQATAADQLALFVAKRA